MQGVFPSRNRIYAIGKYAVVLAHTSPANGIIGKSLSHCGNIEHHFFFAILDGFFPTVIGIVLPLFESGVIGVAIHRNGDRRVILLDSSDDFFIEGFLQLFGGFHYLIKVVVFCVEIVKYILRLFVCLFGFFLRITQTHPKIGIDAFVIVNF